MVTIFAVLYYLMNSKYLLNQQELSYQVPVDRIISTYAILLVVYECLLHILHWDQDYILYSFGTIYGIP